jgi:hypothetical protein
MFTTTLLIVHRAREVRERREVLLLARPGEPLRTTFVT